MEIFDEYGKKRGTFLRDALMRELENEEKAEKVLNDYYEFNPEKIKIIKDFIWECRNLK